jgi:Glycosyl transferase family 2/Glycosyl transferases group 1
MRVNIIGNLRKNTGVSQDIQILHGMIAHVFGKETEISHIPHYHPVCPQAELNFFIEVINPALFVYAAKNIWIPNPEWTYKTSEPYARMVDEIWVKTHEAEKLIYDWAHTSVMERPPVIRYVGWTSIDKVMPEKKNFHKAIVPVGKNMWRNPRPIIQTYMWIEKHDPSFFKTLPELHIVYIPEAIPLPPIPESLQSKIKLHGELMPEKEYDELLQECGLCICMSAIEGFGHAVNEAMSAGCVLILSPIDAFMELTNNKNVFWVSEMKRTPHPQCLGELYDIEQKSLYEALILYCTCHFAQRRGYSNASRERYEANHKAFMERMESVLRESCSNIPTFSLDSRFPKEDDMPPISLITITRDRRPFIPLAKYCYLAQAYPEDKIEWVIVDDGKDQIKDLITDLPNVKYILMDEPMTIGAKRNLAIEKASYDVLVMLDDDDVYPNNSVLTRVAFMLAEPKKECVFCTTIPCYEIHDSKSFMNVPPMTLPMSQRVSEATLCFTRDFWNQRKFPDKQIAEGEAFIQGREECCREICPQEVIVSLIHKKNTTSRKPPQMEPNGCHYGFADELFTLVSEIGLSLQ